jgi:hypothetical protein
LGTKLGQLDFGRRQKSAAINMTIAAITSVSFWVKAHAIHNDIAVK